MTETYANCYMSEPSWHQLALDLFVLESNDHHGPQGGGRKGTGEASGTHSLEVCSAASILVILLLRIGADRPGGIRHAAAAHAAPEDAVEDVFGGAVDLAEV